jgi:acetyl-CoA acetyltransferase
VNGDTIVAGIGQTEFSKESGRSELQLAAEASRAAILDAGLTPADIDGMVTFTIDSSGELDLMRALGIQEVRYWSRTPYGGAGANTTMQHAAVAVASGAANAVLVYRAFNERSGRRFGQPMPQPGRRTLDWYTTFGIRTPAQMYSLWFRRYMDEFGATNEDFGRYTVVARRHAATNPNAWFYQRPITLDDHQQSRWIVEPVLRLLDCCQESDGGVALVVASADRARDLPQPAVRIVAAADAHLGNGGVMYNYYHPDLAVFPEAEFLARQLWERSGLGPDDIDVAMLYENFSPIVFYQLEAFGFCKRGEAKDFIADGNIDLDGALPVNTNGGLLGEAYIHGLNNIVEGVRQVRGSAVNQVAAVDHVLVAAGQSGLVLGHA